MSEHVLQTLRPHCSFNVSYAFHNRTISSQGHNYPRAVSGLKWAVVDIEGSVGVIRFLGNLWSTSFS